MAGSVAVGAGVSVITGDGEAVGVRVGIGVSVNAAIVRAKSLEGLECMGVKIDAGINEATKGGKEGEISAAGSVIRTFVVPTDEELVIARDTVRCIEGVI